MSLKDKLKGLFAGKQEEQVVEVEQVDELDEIMWSVNSSAKTLAKIRLKELAQEKAKLEATLAKAEGLGVDAVQFIEKAITKVDSQIEACKELTEGKAWKDYQTGKAENNQITDEEFEELLNNDNEPKQESSTKEWLKGEAQLWDQIPNPDVDRK